MALSPSFFFFFNDTATTEIYTLSLHDALPICDSTRPYPSKLPELQYPKHWERVRVSHNGLIYWRALRVYIGYLLAGQWIGVQEVAAGQWDVYLGPVRLGCFNEEDGGGPQKD